MKHIHISLILFLLPAFLISCNDSENKELIIGHWIATEWLAGGQPSNYDIEGASFTFDDAGNYSFVYSGNTETGIYFLSNNQLFTTPDGGIKMMVKIVKLTTDTLVFDMNRGGQAEQLTLVRK